MTPAILPRRDDLDGRAILITGAGDGLGRAYALDIARHGASVLVNDMNESAFAVVEEIRATGGTAEADLTPIGTAEAGEATVQACVRAFGRIDGLITNAGVFTPADVTELPVERTEQTVRVNLTGVIHNGVAAIKEMRAAGRGGAIVNIVSASMFGIAEFSVYGATKGGVLTLTYAWAKALEGTGIHVHGLSPLAMTPMMRTSSPGWHSRTTPEDIAPLATYLVSDRAAWLNGKVIRLTDNKLHILTPAEFGPAIGEHRLWDVDLIDQALKGALDNV